MAATPIKHDSNDNIYRGQLFIFLDDAPLAFCSDCSLELTAEEVDVSNKMCAGNWGMSLPGKKTFTASAESLLTHLQGAMSFDTMLKKFIAGDTLDFFFGDAKATEQTETGGKFEKDTAKPNYTGKIMITSLSLKSTNGQIASSSASFKGVGALTPVSSVSPTAG